MRSIGLCTQLACIWEATARKPGNVHRSRDFADLSYVDLLHSAAALAPVLNEAADHSIGATILAAVRARRAVTATNTNLGIVLLLTPLAAVPRGHDLRSGVATLLSRLAVEDAHAVFEAIYLARPGGMGKVAQQDVHSEPSLPLGEVMQLAADRDLIARQYVTGYDAVFDLGLPSLYAGLARTRSLEDAIIFCHLRWLANHPDSLIARKRGRAEAEEAAFRAQNVLDAGWPATEIGREQLVQLDTWLRAEGHMRNPGTSADLVTACLFVALREHTIPVPLDRPFALD